MARTVFLSLLLLAFAAATTPVLKCQSAFEIRPVVDSLQQGALRLIDEESHRGIFVGRKAFFTLSDIDSADVYVGNAEEGTRMFAVNITFKQSLNDSMRSLSGHHIGDRMAIVLDGRILATPRILDPIRTARVSVSVSTEAEARELARKINTAITNH